MGEQPYVPTIGSPHATDAAYKMVWHDEFTGTQLDRSKWTAEDDAEAGEYGNGNLESQVYLDREGETFFVKDGKLTIAAFHKPGVKYPVKKDGEVIKEIDTMPFQAAKLKTEELHSFTYGIFEARIKNPTDASGKYTAIPAWPAFWLLPEKATAPWSGYWDQESLKKKWEWAHSTWPYSGEIDIMEMSGRANRLYHGGVVYHNSPKRYTVGHITWYSHYQTVDGVIDPKRWIHDQKVVPELQAAPGEKSFAQDYYLYGCKWTKDKIIFMLNGKEWGPGLDLTDTKKFGGRKMYNDYPFHLILNLAIGGSYYRVWGPDFHGPDKEGDNELYDLDLFPQYMHIDWVRVYQKP